MIAPRVLSRVLQVFVIVLAVVAGMSSVASAQEIPSGGIVLEELPGIIVEPIVIQPSPIITGDLTGEGDLIGMPTGPIVIEPAPPPSTITASDIPERAGTMDDIFDATVAKPIIDIVADAATMALCDNIIRPALPSCVSAP